MSDINNIPVTINFIDVYIIRNKVIYYKEGKLNIKLFTNHKLHTCG